MGTFKRILVATDFSPASKPAIAESIKLAKESGAELMIVHVYEPPALAAFDGYVPPSVYDQWEEALRAASETSLRPLVEDAQGEGVSAKALISRGIPYLEIVETAKANHADLLVLGTHGRSGLSRFLIGSVAERVVSSAPCPVMTVRGA